MILIAEDVYKRQRHPCRRLSDQRHLLRDECHRFSGAAQGTRCHLPKLATGTNTKAVSYTHLDVYKRQYIDFENPFKEGTYRAIETIKNGNASTADWIPEIPSTGQYAVYAVSYTHLQVRDKYIPLVAIASPVLCFILQKNSEAWFGGCLLYTSRCV